MAHHKLAGKKILIAKDDMFVAEDLCQIVEDAGGKVVALESDAKRLRQAIDATPFDCAVLEVQLVNGLSVEVARRLKESRRPFVIVTAYERESLPLDLQQAPYVAKPFRLGAFIDAIAKAAE